MLLLSLFENDLQTNLILFTILFSCCTLAISFTSYFSSLLIQRREDEIQELREHRESLLITLLFDESATACCDKLLADYKEFSPIKKGNHLSKKKRKLLRQIMIDEMLKLKKNLSGSGVDDLYELYDKLGLHNDSYQKLTGKKYQLMVMGIRELSEMNFKAYYRSIYRCTDHPHEDVRIEAQVAIIRFFGSKGLKFLSRATYTISEWQQMTLLHLLHNMKRDKPKGFDDWFNSKNDSVIIFSVRLAEMYNSFEQIEKIQHFLHHPNDSVKIQSVFCMRSIYDENTELQLLAYYPIVSRPVKIAILEVLQSISTDRSISFLYKQLTENDMEMRFFVLKVLYRLCGIANIVDAVEKDDEVKESVIRLLDQIMGEEQIYN